MSLADISYLELWQPFCLAQQNHAVCVVLVESILIMHEEYFCEIILI